MCMCVCVVTKRVDAKQKLLPAPVALIASYLSSYDTSLYKSQVTFNILNVISVFSAIFNK